MVDLFIKEKLKLPKDCKLKGYEFIAFHPECNQYYYSKEQENDNILLAHFAYRKDKKNYYITENSRVDFLDTFMIHYLLGDKFEDTVEKFVSEELRVVYTKKVPKHIKFKPLDNNEILYVRDTNNLPKDKKHLINTIEIITVENQEEYIIFRCSTFVQSIKTITNKELKPVYINLQNNEILVPKKLLKQ